MTATHAVAWCFACDWTSQDNAKADREAEKHTKQTGHGTVTQTRTSRRA